MSRDPDAEAKAKAGKVAKVAKAAKAPGAEAEAEPDEAFGTLPKLKLAAYLAGCTEAEFGTVSEACAIAAPTLSKTASALEEAGYVRIRKGHVGRRPRTWLSLTAPGRTAFDRHMAALAHLTEVARASAANESGSAGGDSVDP